MWWLLLRLVPRPVWYAAVAAVGLTLFGVVDAISPVVGLLEPAWNDLVSWLESLITGSLSLW